MIPAYVSQTIFEIGQISKTLLDSNFGALLLYKLQRICLKSARQTKHGLIFLLLGTGIFLVLFYIYPIVPYASAV